MPKNMCVSELYTDRVLQVIVKGVFKKRLYVVVDGKLKEVK